MTEIQWQKLEVVDKDGDRPALPSLCGFFYFAADVHAVASDLADSLRRYVDYVGIDSLKGHMARSGYWKPMTKRKLNKDLSHLSDFPPDHVGIRIEYNGGPAGQPEGFGVYAAANQVDGSLPQQTSLLRLDFPVNWLEEHEVDAFLDFVSKTAETPNVQSANVGVTLKTTSGSEIAAVREVNKLLPRYLGIAPCDRHLRDEMLGHTFTAHWLNYVRDDLAASLGGPHLLVERLPDCDVRRLSGGVLIRGAKHPPIGDANRQAPDLGCLPDVARLLKPARLDIGETSFATDDSDFDASEWMERLDDMDARPWDNTHAR